jgi:predicted permease
MLDIFLFAFNAIIPIILLIALGYILKQKNFLSDDFLKTGNKFVFKVCLPCLLFINVYSISSFSDIDWSIVIYAVAAIFVIFGLGMIFVKFFVEESKQKGVVLQCFFRSNYAIIGLPLAQSLGGDKGLEVAAILSAFSIPVFNILAVLALSMYSDGKADYKKVLLNICKNPLILGVVAGLIVLAIRIFIPLNAAGELAFSFSRDVKFLYKAIENISKIASPLALVVLGGTFNFSQTKGMLKQILTGTIGRTVIVPLITIAPAVILSRFTSIINFDHTVYPAMIALFASPVAVSSAIMAAQMKNDGELAGQYVVWTSLVSIITIFIIVVVLKSMALL